MSFTADFDFHLPQELIAQDPSPQRDASRLLVLNRENGEIHHQTFQDLPGFLRAGDVLVLNDSRVIPARLRGQNAASGGKFELLLLEETARNEWWVMMKPGKRGRVGTVITLHDRAGNPTAIRATVLDANAEGHRRVAFTGVEDVLGALESLGEIPLPPYIARSQTGSDERDRERYQTVYAHAAGSIAAPTAGLHFTDALLVSVRERGVETCFVTLHVGLGTFAPVKAERIEEHAMHEERYEIGREAAETIERARRRGNRIVAVGTTSVRVLESVAAECGGGVAARRGRTRIFIHPPAQFAVVNALVTNFHLPRSTLLMLVSAFCAPGSMRGRALALKAYAEAVELRYRFFSYGDAMLIL